jgi:hypothetical protein
MPQTEISSTKESLKGIKEKGVGSVILWLEYCVGVETRKIWSLE